MSTRVSVGSGPRTAKTSVALLPPPSGRTGVTESWGQTIAAADGTAAAAALCALSMRLGADAVDTASPFETLTCPMTVRLPLVARDSAIERTVDRASIVTVRYPIGS